MATTRRLVHALVLVAIISIALLAIGAIALAASAGPGQGPLPPPQSPLTPLPEGRVSIQSTGVLTQLAIILDGSRSVQEWWRSITGTQMAIMDANMPKDGSVELTVVQFGATTARREVGPVALTNANYIAVRNQVHNIAKLGPEGIGTPMACGFYLLADLWSGKTISDTNSPSADAGGWSNGNRAYEDGGGAASGTDGTQHGWGAYGFTLPSSAVIDGIEVRLDARRDAGATRTGAISVELSWGGTNWTTTGYGTGQLGALQATYLLGGSADTWGHAWSAPEVNQIRVRVQAKAGPATTNVYLDWIPVTVYYHIEGYNANLKQVINLASDGKPNVCCSAPTPGYVCPPDHGEQGRLNSVAARNYLLTTLAMTADQDRICAEGLNSGNPGFYWMRDEIVWPQPGRWVREAGPELRFPPDVGWVLDVGSLDDMKTAILVKTVCQPLEVQMTASPTSGCMPLEVTFTGTVSSGTGPYSFYWVFGDGDWDRIDTCDTTATTSHTYEPGVYDVRLMVFDQIGCWGEVYQTNHITANVCLTVTKTDQMDPVCNTWRIRYTINLHNYGLVTLNGVEVLDTLPAGTYFVSADMGGIGAYGVPTVTWKVDVPADTTLPLHLEVGTSAALVGVATNQADVRYYRKFDIDVYLADGDSSPGCRLVFEATVTEDTTVKDCPRPPPPGPTGPWTCPRAGFADYAPHGIPDFDMHQDAWTGSGWTYAGPAASAAALWWLDSQAEDVLGVKYELVTPYGGWGDHDPANVPPLVEDLAGEMGTNSQGTSLENLHSGLLQYLDKKNVSGAFTIEVVKGPSAARMLDEAQHNDAVALLLLGFWQQQADVWTRVGGHWVGACCVDTTGTGLEIADPFFDRAAAGFPGRSFGLPPTDPTVYNDPANVSYDHYDFAPTTVPGAQWAPAGYAGAALLDVVNNSLAMNSAADLDAFAGGLDPAQGVQVAVDYVVFIRPVPGYPPEPQTTITIQEGTFGGSEDTYMYRYANGTNYCASPLLKVGYRQTHATLLRFDLSAIPAGATIDWASLQVYAAGWSGADMTLGAYAVLGAWTVDEATWRDRALGTAWDEGGCNGAADRRMMAESSVTTSGVKQWYEFNLTGLVQEWVDAALDNNGVLLRAEPGTASFQFASATFPDAALHPKLVVTYH